MNTAVAPRWYAGLATIFGSSAASQSSPAPIEQSCVSWQRSGVMSSPWSWRYTPGKQGGAIVEDRA